MSNSIVRVYFNDGSHTYTFPLVQSAQAPEAKTKDVLIEGIRADGSIVIPGGKKSAEIIVKGVIFSNSGYTYVMSGMNTMRTNVTNNVATLSQQHWNGSSWTNDWSYLVKRSGEIEFEESLEYVEQKYTVRFLILSY